LAFRHNLLWRRRITSWCEVCRTDGLPIVLVSEITENGWIDTERNKVHRAVRKDAMDAAGVRRTEAGRFVPAAASEVGSRRQGGRPDRVHIPTHGISLVVVRLRLAQILQVETLIPRHESVGGPIGNILDSDRPV